MTNLSNSFVGYVDQPLDSARGDADAERLRNTGARSIRPESDTEGRPVWREIVATLRQGDVVVVVAFDRLGRPMRTLLRNIAALRGRGVRLRSLEDGVDLDETDQGAAQTRLLRALAGCLDAWGAEDARRRGASDGRARGPPRSATQAEGRLQGGTPQPARAPRCQPGIRSAGVGRGPHDAVPVPEALWRQQVIGSYPAFPGPVDGDADSLPLLAAEVARLRRPRTSRGCGWIDVDAELDRAAREHAWRAAAGPGTPELAPAAALVLDLLRGA